jgi:hypothetical protein
MVRRFLLSPTPESALFRSPDRYHALINPTLNPPVSDLSVLLASAAPELGPAEFVFVCLTDAGQTAALNPLCVFQEAEGTTAICRREMAEAQGHSFSGVFRQITLTVHSSLEAVGFLASVSGALAAEDIPCNVVSRVSS